MNRPYCTLFLAQSVDGKISTGIGDVMDFDSDIPRLLEGMEDYYEEERATDYYSLISGKTLVKLGANEQTYIKNHHPCIHVILDTANLTDTGINHVCSGSDGVILVTDDTIPVRQGLSHDVEVLHVSSRHNNKEWLERLVDVFLVDKLTVQTGGECNASLLRDDAIDEVNLFIVPLLVGGRYTPTLVDGLSLTSPEELSLLNRLQLLTCQALPTGFLHVKYKVIHR